MCKVKDIKECKKRIVVVDRNGKVYVGGWFTEQDYEICEDSRTTTKGEYNQYIQLLTKRGVSMDDVSGWKVNHDRTEEEDTVYISKHAEDRLKERNGWTKKTITRMIPKIVDNGTSYRDLKGAVRDWVDERMRRYPDNDEYIVYGERLYVFSKHMLITVLLIPKEVMKSCHKKTA